MKTLLAIIAFVFSALTATAAAKPEVVTFRLVNPTGPRWAVEKDGEQVLLTNPPTKQFAKVISGMRDYHGFKTRIANLESTIDNLDREYDRLNAAWSASDSGGKQIVSTQRSVVNAQRNEAMRQLRDTQRAFSEFRRKNDGDTFEAPEVKVTAIPTGRKIGGVIEWRYLGPAP